MFSWGFPIPDAPVSSPAGWRASWNRCKATIQVPRTKRHTATTPPHGLPPIHLSVLRKPGFSITWRRQSARRSGRQCRSTIRPVVRRRDRWVRPVLEVTFLEFVPEELGEEQLGHIAPDSIENGLRIVQDRRALRLPERVAEYRGSCVVELTQRPSSTMLLRPLAERSLPLSQGSCHPSRSSALGRKERQL